MQALTALGKEPRLYGDTVAGRKWATSTRHTSLSREDLLARFGEVGDRRRLYELFLDLVAQLSELQVRGDLFVCGSFVTKKFKPNDIDVAIDLSREPPSSPSPRVAWRLSEDFWR